MGKSNFGHTARREFRAPNSRVQAVISDRGISDCRTYFKLTEEFAKLPVSQAASLPATVTTAALTSNVATITTKAAHGYVVGQSVLVALTSGIGTGNTYTTFNGVFVVTAVGSSTTFSYAVTNADLASTASAGTTIAVGVSAGFNVAGTGTPVTTFANQFDFGGGILMATSTANADSNYLLPSLVSGNSAWAVARQWSSERSPHFEAIVTPTPATQITTVALTSNVATITTGAAHGLFPGESVTIRLDQADSDYAASSSLEGTWVILEVPTTTTFTFSFTHANVSSASIVGSCKPASDLYLGPAGLAVTNIALTSNVVTVTTAKKHGLSANCVVTLSIDQNSTAFLALSGAAQLLLLALQGQQTVTSAYSASATTFTFAKTAADITTGAFTGKVFEVNAGSPQVKKTEIWAGFKKTFTPVVATDDDQCFFKYDASVSPYWYLITSRAGTDISTPLPVIVEMGVSYRLEISISADRTIIARINGVDMPIDTSAAALTNGIDLIPYVGVKASGIVPAAKAITLAMETCNRALTA